MIVDKHHGRRGQLQRPLHHLTDIDGRVIDGALLLHLICDDLVALIEEEDADFGQAVEIVSPRPGTTA